MAKKIINASDIGKTAYCPKAHYLSTKHRHGWDTQQRLNTGNYKHNQMTKRAMTKQDKRCFVASYALGENHLVTQDLRNFRDEKLLTTGWGRAFVAAYYFLSPKFIWLFGNSKAMKAFSQGFVQKFHAWFAANSNK